MNPQAKQVWLLRALVGLGSICLAYYFSWWMDLGRISSPGLILALLSATLFSGFQLVGSWVLYLCARRDPPPLPPAPGMSVDVFVTTCNEPYPLVRRALAAACAMRGASRVWLLDDGMDPALRELASKLGAGYVKRSNRDHAKAGNLNAALACTTGDIIAIFDVDHAPTPNFLEHTLGYLSDSRIGFVQVMLTFCNGDKSWVARAAAESSLDFYNPVSLGMHRIGGATMMGSNALIRRAALTSIGGYQPGLAEDLATSLMLHAAGWQSAYVPEPLAPGLAPADLESWFTQQLKWARGVFEVLVTRLPRAFPRLTWSQRLCYGVRMSYYLLGPVIAAHLLVAFAVIVAGNTVARQNFEQYLVSLFLLCLLVLLIRYVALRCWRNPATGATNFVRAVILVYSTWPVYTLAWLMAVLRVPLAFRPTPKGSNGVLKPLWLFPQFAQIILLTIALSYSFFVNREPPSIVLIVFLLSQIVLQAALFFQNNFQVDLPKQVDELGSPFLPPSGE